MHIDYMQRTRDYYRAQGYSKDYAWAEFAADTFTPLTKPVSDSRVTVITTTTPLDAVSETGPQVVSVASLPQPDAMITDNLSWDRENTHTNDVGSFLPLSLLSKLQEEGVIGSLAPRFHSVPTEYSQRRTLQEDAPDILKRCQEDKCDLALLVPL